MTDLQQIETAALHYADAREQISDLVTSLRARIDALQREAMPAIKRAVNKAADRHAALQTLLESSPELFTEPRTVIFHGIKVGWTKGKGKIVIDDKKRTLALIKKHLPDLAELLIKTTERPNKKALADLEVADLRRIGCTVEATGDVVIIRPTDREIDKLVTALLANAMEEAKEAA